MANTSRLRIGLAAAATAFTALAAGAAFAFGKFEEAENVLQQTGAVIKSTGGAAHVTANQVAELSDALSAKAGVDDEVIQAGENMLLTFKNIRNEAGKNNDIFNQASVAALDLAAGYAAASGSEINLKASTIQLGKALNDPIAGMSALTRVGVQFSEEQQHQIEQLVKHNNLLGAQKIILGEVTSQFQGSAEAQATASGKARVAFENLAETVGQVLAPLFTAMLNGLQTLVGWLQDKVAPAWDAFAEGVGKAWDAVKPFVETIGNTMIPFLETAWNAIQDHLIPALARLKPLFILIGGAIVVLAALFVTGLAEVVTAVSFVLDAFLDFVGFVRDKVVEPVVNFLARIVSFLQEKLRPVWDVIRDAAVSAFHAILGPIQAVINIIETLIGWIAKAIDLLHDMFAAGGAAANVSAQTGRPGVGNAVPQAATGGFVARSGLAIIHQGETISPAGTGGMTVIINGDVTGEEVVKKVRDGLLKLGNRNAGTGL